MKGTRPSLLSLSFSSWPDACVTPPVGPPAVSPPDLRGTWIGDLGRDAAALRRDHQQISTGRRPRLIGSWQPPRQYYPTVTGS